MCVEPTTLLLASTAVSGVSAIAQGQQAQAMGNYQAAQAQADADATKAAALIEAKNIRAAGKRQQSAAMAAQAASGVTIDSGTAEVINREIATNSEYDAQIAILTGGTRARQLSAQGEAARISGNNAATAGFLNAGASALRAGYTVGSGWKSTADPLSWMRGTGKLGD